MKLSVLTNLFAGLPFDEALAKFEKLGIDAVEIGCGGYPGKAHCDPKVLLASDAALKEWCDTVKRHNLEVCALSCFDFCQQVQDLGVKTIICTDISKDGMMAGTNRALYKDLCERFSLNIIASGGVSSLDDVRALADMKLFGAIVGKAIYTGAIDLSEAIAVAKERV